ncbi:MAG: hypothetical protein ACTSQP_22760 [Promethearchaeota archaeon]
MDEKKIAEFYKKNKNWIQIPMEQISERLKVIEEDQGIKFDYETKLVWKFFIEHLINDYDNTLRMLEELEVQVIKEAYKKYLAEQEERGQDD